MDYHVKISVEKSILGHTVRGVQFFLVRRHLKLVSIDFFELHVIQF